MRYLLAGGGTAGHIYPALTIGRALQQLDPEAELLYVGTETGREAAIVPRAGISFVSIASSKMVNRSLRQKLSGGFRVIKGLLDSLRHIRRYRPDLVIGTGGFVSGPVLLAAYLTGVPVIIQEQNAFPGVTNRIAARWAKAVFVPYAEARPHFPAGTCLEQAGNPVRPEIGLATRAEGRAAFGFTETAKVLLVMGGSGGARDFHRAAVAAIRLLIPRIPGLRVLHITGERYLEQVTELYGNTCGILVLPYLHNMPEAYGAADAGLFRAGALTLAEIQVRGLPSVLIPSPNVTHDHQEWNARTLEERGAALVLREREITAEGLTSGLHTLLTDRVRAAAMSKALLALAQPDAGRRIAEAAIRIARQRRQRTIKP